MKLLYEGTDITNDVQIRRADFTDNAGNVLDSLELDLNDTQGLWSKWKPEKNHTVQVVKNGFDTGIMYVDEIGQRRGTVLLKTLPIKQEAKTERFKSWENVRFMQLFQEIASRWELNVAAYNVTNHYYDQVDQAEADFKFLAWRCLLEGYALKISNNQLIIYDQAYIESQTSVKTITVDDIDGDFDFKNKSSGIYGACRIICKDIDYIHTVGMGPTLKINDVLVTNIGEAQRFTKGILRSRNCFEKTMGFTYRYDAGIAAGNIITTANFGLADGKYYVQQIIHKFVEQKSKLKLRGLLEGY